MRRAMLGLLAGPICRGVGKPRDAWGQFTDGNSMWRLARTASSIADSNGTISRKACLRSTTIARETESQSQVTRIPSAEAKALAPMFGRGPYAGPIQVLVFKSEAEFRQSNVGVMTSQDPGDQHRRHGQARRKQDVSVRSGRPAGDGARRARRVGMRILFNQTMYESQWTEKPSEKTGTSFRFLCMDVGRRCAVCRSGAGRREHRPASWTPRRTGAIRTLGSGFHRKRCGGVGPSGLGLRGGHLRPAHDRQRPLHDPHHPESRNRLSTWPRGLARNDLALEVRDPLICGRAPTWRRPPFARHSNRRRPCDKRAERQRAGSPLRLKERSQYTQSVPSPDGNPQWAFTTNMNAGSSAVGTVGCGL